MKKMYEGIETQQKSKQNLRYAACHHCLRSIEAPLEMARRLTSDKTLNLPVPDTSAAVNVAQFRFCPSA